MMSEATPSLTLISSSLEAELAPLGRCGVSFESPPALQ